MCGLAMTATAVSLTMVSLQSEGLGASPVATRIMTSAVLDDIASLALVAIAVPLVAESRTVQVADLGWIIFKVMLFFAIITMIGRRVLSTSSPRGLLSRYEADH